LGGVEPEEEITSIVVMKGMSKKPSKDLPNQEMNQYRTLYIDGKQGPYIQKGEKELDQKDRIKKIMDLLDRG